MAPGSFSRDDFPNVPGPPGTAHPDIQPQRPVLKQRIFEGKEGDAARVFKHLYPGDPAVVVAKVWAAMQKRGCTEPLTVGEWFVFLGLMCAATLYVETGRDLWSPPEKQRVFAMSPGFSEFIYVPRFASARA